MFLHVGTMKSATTYLQGLFDRNAERLSEAGVWWPSSASSFLAVADFRGTQDVDRPGRAGAWRRFAGAVQRYDGNVLLSNELLAPLGKPKIERLAADLAPAELRVILTARDLARVIPSHWQTTLKNGSQLPWSDFAATVCRDAPPDDHPSSAQLWAWFWRRHDVPEIARRWVAATGASGFHLVTVPQRTAESTTVARRFAAALAVELPALVEPAFANSSMGAHSAELLRRLNQGTGERSRSYYRWGVKEGLGVALAKRAREEPGFGLSRTQDAWVQGRARRLIEETSRFGGSVHGDLADLQPPAVRGLGAEADPAESADSSLLASALFAMGDLVKTAGDLSRDRELRFRSGSDRSVR